MVKLSALAFGLLTAVAQVSAQSTVRVMPFGASIVSRCWRANLQTKLRIGGTTNFDFVGSQSGACSGAGVDQDHEGHPGSQATDYAAKGNLTVWLNAQPQVDVIVMLLGTNDVLLGKKPTGEIIRAYDVLISQMRAKNPKMYIIFSNLLPLDIKRWPQSGQEGIVNLNTAIRQYVPSKNTRDSPVVFVDNYSGFDPVADTTDGEHPNDAGNEKMANKFFAATRDAIKAISGTSSSSPKNQAQAQDQAATPTLIVSSTKTAASSKSASSSQVTSSSQATPSGSSSRATSAAASSSTLTSIAAQSQTTGSPSSSATPSAATQSATQSATPSASGQTSSATSLRAPWPLLSLWKSMQFVLSR